MGFGRNFKEIKITIWFLAIGWLIIKFFLHKSGTLFPFQYSFQIIKPFFKVTSQHYFK
jgi:hypothetical protein